MSATITGSSSTTIDRPRSEVFAAISQLSRMGDWSPENTGGRWIDGADGPAVGAKFEGDNIAKAGPITLKKWTTISEVTKYSPDELFEFIAEDYTTWRFELTEDDGSTTITESYSFADYAGVQRFIFVVLGRRHAAVAKGVESTLARLKVALES